MDQRLLKEMTYLDEKINLIAQCISGLKKTQVEGYETNKENNLNSSLDSISKYCNLSILLSPSSSVENDMDQTIVNNKSNQASSNSSPSNSFIDGNSQSSSANESIDLATKLRNSRRKRVKRSHVSTCTQTRSLSHSPAHEPSPPEIDWETDPTEYCETFETFDGMLSTLGKGNKTMAGLYLLAKKLKKLTPSSTPIYDSQPLDDEFCKERFIYKMRVSQFAVKSTNEPGPSKKRKHSECDTKYFYYQLVMNNIVIDVKTVDEKIKPLRSNARKGKFKCLYENCSKESISQSNLMDHIKTHFNIRYKCYYCEAKHANGSNFRRHLRTKEWENGIAQQNEEDDGDDDEK